MQMNRKHYLSCIVASFQIILFKIIYLFSGGASPQRVWLRGAPAAPLPAGLLPPNLPALPPAALQPPRLPLPVREGGGPSPLQPSSICKLPELTQDQKEKSFQAQQNQPTGTFLSSK